MGTKTKFIDTQYLPFRNMCLDILEFKPTEIEPLETPLTLHKCRV